MNKKKGMFGSIVTLLFGNLGGQVIALMAIPIITRIFPPGEYGKVTTLWAVVTLFGVVSCLKYEDTIIIEKDEAQAQIIASNCILISVVLSLFVWILIAGFELIITDSYLQINNSPLIISIGVLCFGLSKIYNSLVIKANKFKLVGASLLVGALVSALLKISAGYYLVANAEVLMVGNIVGMFVPFFLLSIMMRKRYTFNSFSASVEDRLKILKSYSDFPTIQTPNAFINAAQQHAPIIILSNYYDASFIGFYGLAIAMLMRPINALTNAVSKVYLQRLASQVDDHLHGEFIKVIRILAVIALIPSTVLAFYGSSIFAFILGDQWRESGYLATMLVPWLFMVMINSPATQIMLVKRKLRYIFFYNIIYLLARVSGIFVAMEYLNDFYMVILVFSMIGFFANIFYIRKGIEVSKNT